MADLVGLWNRLRTRTRQKGRRTVRPSGLSYERYGIDLLEKRQMLAVTPASDFTYTTANDQVAITGYKGAATVVEIPASINSLPVTSIGDNAFEGKDLTSVMLPSGVTSIGYNAFYNCRSLASITLPSGVTDIGGFAFNMCTSLTTVSIPASVARMGDNPFVSCVSLTAISVSPDSAAFGSRDGLLYTKDGTALISYPAGRQGGFAIPTGVTSVGNSAFRDCSGLTSVTIPDSVTYLGQAVFWNCGGLTSIFIPDSVSRTDTSVMTYCRNLRSARLSNSLTMLGSGFFSDCYKLTDVTIPAGVTVVGADTFDQCTSLTWIAIPTGVASIGRAAFRGCSSLTTVQMHGSPPTLGDVVFNGVNPNQATVYYPESASGWTTSYGGLPTKPYGVPDVPTAVVGVRGNGQVQLSWTAPVSNGGVAVTDYTIQYSTDGSSWQTFTHAASTATSATVTGLTNGTAYLFRVASVNNVGTGLYSANSSAVTPATTPVAPTAVVGIRGNGQVQLSWTAPVSDGGLPVKDYAIQYSSNSGVSWQTFSRTASTATSATVTGLTNGTGYLFRVASVNDVGTGSFTATASSITPNAVPLPPTNIVATRGRGVVTVSWTAPVSNGGVRITDYRVQYSTNGGVSWVTVRDGVSTSTRTVVSGLVMGRGYIFRVAAVGRSGAGDFSSASAVVTPATVPAAPVGVLATGGLGQVVLSWRAPTSTGGSPINQYVVQYSPSAGRWLTSTTVGSNTTTATVGGLLANRSYSLRVLALNDMGSSPASRVVAAKTLRASPALVQA
jgi:hypothetical protein